MRKLLKVVLMIFIIFIFTCIVKNEIYASSQTGHPSFDEIILPEGRNIYLLANSKLSTKKKRLSKVNWKMFGASVYTDLYKVRVGFKKPNTFVRSNRTSNVIEYEYTFTTTLKAKYSYNKDETSKLDVSAKISKFGASLETKVNEELGITVEGSIEQELNYTITINPYTKVSIYSTGEAYLSQGAMKYYFFGIPIYSCNWENIEVIAEYYELYEENYK